MLKLQLAPFSHAETAIAQYSAALRELAAATGQPITWAPSLPSLQNITKGLARQLDAQVSQIFKDAIAKL